MGGSCLHPRSGGSRGRGAQKQLKSSCPPPSTHTRHAWRVGYPLLICLCASFCFSAPLAQPCAACPVRRAPPELQGLPGGCRGQLNKPHQPGRPLLASYFGAPHISPCYRLVSKCPAALQSSGKWIREKGGITGAWCDPQNMSLQGGSGIMRQCLPS